MKRHSAESTRILDDISEHKLLQLLLKTEEGQLKPFETSVTRQKYLTKQEEKSYKICSGLDIPSSSKDQKQPQFLMDIPSDKMINHDVQLKKYIASKRLAKQKTLNEKIHYSNSTKIPQTPRVTKHKKQKSRSQIYPHKLSHKIHSQPTNQSEALEEIERSSKQTQVKNVGEYKKSKSKKKGIQFFEPARQSVKPVSLRSLEMQLVVRKTNEKRQSIINEIIKKLHLPQVNPRISNSLRMLVNNYQAEKQFVACEKKSMKSIEIKGKKHTTGKQAESVFSSKADTPRNTMGVRKCNKENQLSKIRFISIKDEQRPIKLRHAGPESQKIDCYRLFA